MEALANLGIDWRLFVAQGVNFLVLLFVLRRYAYRPMLEFLEKRSQRIEQGLKDAEAAQVKLAEMEASEKKILASARDEARVIINTAEASAKQRDALRLMETEAKVKHSLDEAMVKIEEEKKKMLLEVRQEISAVALLAVEKILKEKIDAEKDAQLIEKMLK